MNRNPLSISFFFSSRRRHTRWPRDWSSDVCSSDLLQLEALLFGLHLALTVGGNRVIMCGFVQGLTVKRGSNSCKGANQNESFQIGLYFADCIKQVSCTQ